MGKLLLVFSVLFLAAPSLFAASDAGAEQAPQRTVRKYLPLVEEGKTWWYTNGWIVYNSRGECGIRIGEAEEIDGTVWYRLSYCQRDDYNDNDGWSRTFEEGFIGHIREDDNGTIYTRLNPSKTYDYYPMDHTLWNDYRSFADEYHSPLQDRDEDIVIEEHRGQPGETGDTYYIGDTENEYLVMIIDGVDEIENSGVTRKVFKTIVDPKYCDIENPIPGMASFQKNNFIEGIGWDNVLFCNPSYAECSCMGTPHVPYLRYVTDKDNNVVYEGVGGVKIWKESVGVEEVSVDSEAEAEYFNLHGIRVENPSQPGVYIERKGEQTRKVYVR